MRDRGDVSGDFGEIAVQIQSLLADLNGKPVPMNINGATAAFYGELDFPPELARSLFCLSRSVAAMAHGNEQMEQCGRNKGFTPHALSLALRKKLKMFGGSQQDKNNQHRLLYKVALSNTNFKQKIYFTMRYPLVAIKTSQT